MRRSTPSSSSWIIDHVRTPLPPCTLEALPEPISVPITILHRSHGCHNNSKDKNKHGVATVSFWPVLVGCYRLDDEVQPAEESLDRNRSKKCTHQTRSGQLQLYVIPVPQQEQPQEPVSPYPPTTMTHLSLGKPYNILDPSTSSGILDCKWMLTTTTTATLMKSQNPSLQSLHIFGTAHSTGEIRIHALHVTATTSTTAATAIDNDEEEEASPAATKVTKNNSNNDPLQQQQYYRLRIQTDLGTSQSTLQDLFPSSPPPLCLSINWQPPLSSTSPLQQLDSPRLDPKAGKEEQQQKEGPKSIIYHRSLLLSTYSNGHVALHDVVFFARSSLSSSQHNGCELRQVGGWLAHSLSLGRHHSSSSHPHPCEVWCGTFLELQCENGRRGNKRIVVATGGEDGTVKLWEYNVTALLLDEDEDSHDVPSQPPIILLSVMAVGSHSSGGVTALSVHPQLLHVLAVGSYDASIQLWNTVNVVNVKNVDVDKEDVRRWMHVEVDGGGVWRLQWHPRDPERMLVAALHGGACVVQFPVNRLAFSSLLLSSSPSSLSAAAATTKAATELVVAVAAEFKDECIIESDTSLLPVPRVTKSFSCHTSMVYGCTWLVDAPQSRKDTDNDSVDNDDDDCGSGGSWEAAASCSFYDQNFYVWDSQS